MKPEHWAYKGATTVASFLSNIRVRRAQSESWRDANPFDRFLSELPDEPFRLQMERIKVGETYFHRRSYLEQSAKADWQGALIPLRDYASALVKKARAKQIPLYVEKVSAPNSVTISHGRFLNNLTETEKTIIRELAEQIAVSRNRTVHSTGLQISMGFDSDEPHYPEGEPIHLMPLSKTL